MTALVVLPGLDGTATLHSAFVEAVAPAFESVAVVSYPTDRTLDYDALEELVRAKLPTTVPFVLLGESFSGPLALSIAANPPLNFMGLMLSTSFAKFPTPLLKPLGPFMRLAPFRWMPRAVSAWWLLGRWRSPRLEDSLESALRSVQPAVLGFRAALALEVDASSHLSALRMPVLYLRASEDRLLPRAAAKLIQSSSAQCTVRDIQGPHLLLQAQPQICARAVAEFAAHLSLVGAA